MLSLVLFIFKCRKDGLIYLFDIEVQNIFQVSRELIEYCEESVDAGDVS